MGLIHFRVGPASVKELSFIRFIFQLPSTHYIGYTEVRFMELQILIADIRCFSHLSGDVTNYPENR